MVLRCSIAGIPWVGILGFIFGCCITIILGTLFLPSPTYYWPSLYENRDGFYGKLYKANYSYYSAYELFRSFSQGAQVVDESDYLARQVKILCYFVDSEVKNVEHSTYILKTWAKHCDRTVMFYSNLKIMEEVRIKNVRMDPKISLEFIDKSNSSASALVRFFRPIFHSYHWFVYVPAYVFLIPENLRYYLYSTHSDYKSPVFIGKPTVGRLFGDWSLSDQSPLVISTGALIKAFNHMDSSCLMDELNDPRCLVEICRSQLVNLRQYDGIEVIHKMEYTNFFVSYAHVDAKTSLPSRFPVSVFIQGTYKKFYDLEYYIHHLKAYGQYSLQGSWSKIINKDIK